MVSGDFTIIDWSSDTYFLKVEMYITGGTTYEEYGTSQLLSVPYAMHAKTAANTFSGNYNDLSGAPINVSAFTNDAGYLTSVTETDPIFNVWDKSTGISITESQISDLNHFTTGDETDPTFTASEAVNITATDITNLGNLSGTNTGDQDLSALATKSNVLELDNAAAFIPDADYEPATKKYVDSLIARLDSLIGLVSPPVADFSADNTMIYVDGTVSFTDESTNTPTSWSWNFGDGSSESTEQNPSHVYSSPGTYTVTLTATNVSGSDDEEKIDYITVIEVGTVINSTTGRIWMDRNLGASQVATIYNDADAYGDLFQWGRAADGHEKRTSLTTTTNATTAVPDDGNSWDGLFIIESDSPYDWLTTPDDNLWQGVSGTNNPCPSGFRIPTEAEWASERTSWGSQNSAGAFASPLKLTVGGYRVHSYASFSNVGNQGIYWSSNVQDYWGRALAYGSSTAGECVIERAKAISVLCIKEE